MIEQLLASMLEFAALTNQVQRPQIQQDNCSASDYRLFKPKNFVRDAFYDVFYIRFYSRDGSSVNGPIDSFEIYEIVYPIINKNPTARAYVRGSFILVEYDFHSFIHENGGVIVLPIPDNVIDEFNCHRGDILDIIDIITNQINLAREKGKLLFK